MAALSNPTVLNAKWTVDRTIDLQITSVASAANYKVYMGSTEFDAAAAVTSANSQKSVSVAAQNGGAGLTDVIHVHAGVIPDSWPGVAYVVTALDSNNANESTGTSHASLLFSR